VKKYEKQKPADSNPSVRQSSVISAVHQFPQWARLGADLFSASNELGPASPVPDTVKYSKNIGMFIKIFMLVV